MFHSIVSKFNRTLCFYLGWSLRRKMKRQFLPFSHAGREIEIFFSHSEKWEENFFPFRKKSLILLILVGKNVIFLDFFSCGKGNPQKKSPFPMGEGKLKKKISRSGKWEKNLFPSHKKSLILLILVGKNSIFSDFFSCGKEIEKNLPAFLPFPPRSPWKMLRKTMTKRLIFIFQACIDVEYHSKSFREAKTIVLKKIKKSDYIFFKVYRSIALLNTMNKMLKLIMTNKITELAKKNLLLWRIFHSSLDQWGARP